jgi:hypothetical protein
MIQNMTTRSRRMTRAMLPSMIDRTAAPERVDDRATSAGADEAEPSLAVGAESVVETVIDAGTTLLCPIVWAFCSAVLSGSMKSPWVGPSVGIQGGVGDARVSIFKLSLEKTSISRDNQDYRFILETGTLQALMYLRQLGNTLTPPGVH